MNDPNWTRSYGYSFEPTEHTGLLGSYQFASWLSLEAGIADTLTTIGGTGSPSAINARSESRRAFLSMVTLTAPDSWGFLKGSALYGALDYGPGAFGYSSALPGGLGGGNTTEWYAGLTLNTPVTGLTAGASYDSISDCNVGGLDAGYFASYAGYLTYKISDKANVDGRIEYADGTALSTAEDFQNGLPLGDGTLSKVIALTGTFEYDLWANVMSRLEVRWDHNASGGGLAFGGETLGAPVKNNEVLIAANLIYKF